MNIYTIRPQVALVVAVVAAILIASVAGCSSESSQSSQSNSPTVNSAVAKKYPGCPEHMNDGKNAPEKKATNLRGVEYGEFSLICGNGVAAMYNTTYMNNPKSPAVPVPKTQETAPCLSGTAPPKTHWRWNTTCQACSRTAPVSG